MLDGEIVVLDGDGYPNLAALMRSQSPPSFLTFDVLAIGDCDLCDEPLDTRKYRLAELMSGMAGPVIQNTQVIIGEGRALFDLIAARGMEGIVAKRLGSRYAPGRRTGVWIKVKVPDHAPERFSNWFNRGRQRQRSQRSA